MLILRNGPLFLDSKDTLHAYNLMPPSFRRSRISSSVRRRKRTAARVATSKSSRLRSRVATRPTKSLASDLEHRPRASAGFPIHRAISSKVTEDSRAGGTVNEASSVLPDAIDARRIARAKCGEGLGR